ncbi:MAG TPA: ABC transporter ATP-binding protein [Gemmatimonadaceae bacterium]|nr:ABC transporter ATP-binding protein [Gemmatimonadaceae bacterium]
MIRFEDVVARYPRADHPAVRGVSFAAPRGHITAVVGPNGSGKSTLVRALIGRLPLASGRVLVDGDDAAAMDGRSLARRVAVVTQREEPVFPLDVRDFVALGRFPHRGAWRAASADDARAVDRAVERSGIGDLVGRRTDELSGGEWQRVRIARALAQDAPALVLDEPTTFLDVAHEMGVFELLDALARAGHAVLLVSHQLNLVARFAATLVLLHEGTVAALGPPADVMRGPVLEPVYQWPLVVIRDAAVGAPALVPLRTRSRAGSGSGESDSQPGYVS